MHRSATVAIASRIRFPISVVCAVAIFFRLRDTNLLCVSCSADARSRYCLTSMYACGRTLRSRISQRCSADAGADSSGRRSSSSAERIHARARDLSQHVAPLACACAFVAACDAVVSCQAQEVAPKPPPRKLRPAAVTSFPVRSRHIPIAPWAPGEALRHPCRRAPRCVPAQIVCR